MISDNTYSDREIDTMMKDVHEKLDLILAQTSRTNGRVTALEQWRWYIVGIGTALLILLPVLYNKNDNSIEKLSAQVLDNTKTIQRSLDK